MLDVAFALGRAAWVAAVLSVTAAAHPALPKPQIVVMTQTRAVGHLTSSFALSGFGALDETIPSGPTLERLADGSIVVRVRFIPPLDGSCAIAQLAQDDTFAVVSKFDVSRKQIERTAVLLSQEQAKEKGGVLTRYYIAVACSDTDPETPVYFSTFYEAPLNVFG